MPLFPVSLLLASLLLKSSSFWMLLFLSASYLETSSFCQITANWSVHNFSLIPTSHSHWSSISWHSHWSSISWHSHWSSISWHSHWSSISWHSHWSFHQLTSILKLPSANTHIEASISWQSIEASNQLTLNLRIRSADTHIEASISWHSHWSFHQLTLTLKFPLADIHREPLTILRLAFSSRSVSSLSLPAFCKPSVHHCRAS